MENPFHPTALKNMLKRFLCFIFGHLWKETSRDTGSDVDIVTQACTRCGEVQSGMNL